MKQHERIHTGDKLLVCSVCQKKFTTRQALLHHVVVHTGEEAGVGVRVGRIKCTSSILRRETIPVCCLWKQVHTAGQLEDSCEEET